MARGGSFIFNIEILWVFKVMFTRINLMLRRDDVYPSNKSVSTRNPTNVKKLKMCTQGKYHSGRGTAKNASSVAHRAQLRASHPEERASMAQIIKLPMVPNRRAFAAFGFATKIAPRTKPKTPPKQNSAS
jgi:hypothetical protein